MGTPVATPVMDVVAHLEKLAAANPQKLNSRTSIADLLKLLDIDSSFGARKELATELGCPADLMHDFAKMNMWLHRTVLQKIAENGGNIPKELLDWRPRKRRPRHEPGSLSTIRAWWRRELPEAVT